ncbi:NADPH-dependent FMN reductase [Vibrio renipiscarius]|uniref:NADPH-dependent FMN reductase n=1 Tax=Vibrio renipiscarius TaxID=1461322 RepID=A0A0C2JKJ6_9VIBR|nr:NADPH-dependent FMN reductase [Vibrio renipiscarius]KII77288.1 NADPH-dependent FMN reductase [Vibrio renipiscarius]KII78489.1 NADPH-dependent FMN reductase [Vibrio renipiscarius]
MNILAFGASTSSTSINKTLANYAAHQLAQKVNDAEITLIDLNQFPVPLFSEDVEKEIGQAEAAKAFLEQIAQADVLIISFAEHNGSYTAAYKNLFDWASRINPQVFQGKSAVYFATSPGPGGGKNVLATATASAGYFGAEVKASLSIPSFYEHFDFATGEFKDAELAEQINLALDKLTE